MGRERNKGGGEERNGGREYRREVTYKAKGVEMRVGMEIWRRGKGEIKGRE